MARLPPKPAFVQSFCIKLHCSHHDKCADSNVNDSIILFEEFYRINY